MAHRLAASIKVSAAAVFIAANFFTANTTLAQTVDLGDFIAPSTLSYQNSFNAPLSQFTDWYSFSLDKGNFNGITASISFAQLFGVQLTTELYQGSLTGTQVNLGSLIATGSNNVSQVGNALQTTSVFAPITLSGGDYLIKVSGAVVGSLGGGYAGIANMAPVPVPPTLPLAACGMVLLGVMTRRGRKRG